MTNLNLTQPLLLFRERFLRPLLWLAAACCSLLALAWMGFKFEQLLFDDNLTGMFPTGPADLISRYRQLQELVQGTPIFLTNNGAVYPPATYLILWPLIGWVTEEGARWMWAVTSLGALVWLSFLVVRVSGETACVRQVLLALLPVLLFATGATIGVGQMGIHILPVLLVSLLLLVQRDRWGSDLLAAALFLFALIKPTLTAPFFWLVLFLPQRLRPALLLLLFYALCTVAVSFFQPFGPVTLLQQWYEVGSSGAEWGAKTGGIINQQTWLHAWGAADFSTELSLLILAAWGGWVFRYRHQSVWLLIGATAIVARLWIYHRYHDDLLLLLPMLTFYRMALHDPQLSLRRTAMLFFAAGVFTTITPLGSWRLPALWVDSYQIVQTVTWLAMLSFFWICAEQLHRTAPVSSPSLLTQAGNLSESC